MTRRPTSARSTPAPTACTTPHGSWPPITGVPPPPSPSPAAAFPVARYRCRSLPHIPDALMASTTSPGPGTEPRNSRTSSCRLPRNTIPRISPSSGGQTYPTAVHSARFRAAALPPQSSFLGGGSAEHAEGVRQASEGGQSPPPSVYMTSPIISEALKALIERRDLSRIEAAAAMEAIMSGAATNAQIAAFLTALRMKGETVEELIGFAQVMRQKVVRIRTRADEVAALTGTDREMLIDTCGTGGDATGTFNVSTATAFVVAGAGLRVAKHGNRSVSSLCGSADVVEALGINLDLTPQKVARCVDEVGIGFLYAPLLHTAMKHVMPVRREMAIRTVFNMLGPLTNPASANAQIIGVYSASLTEPLARVLAELGTVRAFVVHGADHLDEISNTGESRVSEVREGMVRSYTVRPDDFGLPRATIGDLRGGDRQQNADIIRALLSGEPGPKRDIVLMNAAAALVAGARAKDLKEGVELAARSIDSGAARGKVDALIALSKQLASTEV